MSNSTSELVTNPSISLFPRISDEKSFLSITNFDNEKVRPKFDENIMKLDAKLVTKDINGNTVTVN